MNTDKADAARYRWLKSRNGLTLRSERQPNMWRRADGSEFSATHFLAEGGTQHAAADSLDALIDAAMLLATNHRPTGRHNQCSDQMTDHTRNVPTRCVTISDADDAVIRRAGKGIRAEGIRELVRVYLERKKERKK